MFVPRPAHKATQTAETDPIPPTHQQTENARAPLACIPTQSMDSADNLHTSDLHVGVQLTSGALEVETISSATDPNTEDKEKKHEANI